MRKVLIYHNFDENQVNKIKRNFPMFDFVVCTNRKDMENNIEDAEILIGFKLDEEMLNKAKKLKWVQLIRAGVDKTPLESIKKRGIILTSGRGIHKDHMAEYAIAVMIMLARNWHQMFRYQIEGKWNRSPRQGEICGSTLGILGLGSIGSEIAKRASLFGMKVIGTKKNVSDIPFVDKVYEPEDMEFIFKESDYIINLLPATEETRGIINKHYFELMKETACFVNMGRGSTVNEEDLIEILRNRRIRAMATDVYENEPLPEDSPLWQLDNVILTPHICGESYGKYEEKALTIIEKNLRAYMENRDEMINVIDLDKGY